VGQLVELSETRMNNQNFKNKLAFSEGLEGDKTILRDDELFEDWCL
jgi:hypothetical protein